MMKSHRGIPQKIVLNCTEFKILSKNGSLGGLCDGTKRHRQIPESVEPHFIEQTHIGQLVSRCHRTCTAPEIPQDLPAAALFVVQATENNYISMC